MPIWWPSSLPKYPDREGFGGEFRDALLRSKPDVGPAKVRRRATATPEPFSMSWLLTWDELQILRAFYVDDLEMGSLPFYMNHPIDYNVELVINPGFETGDFTGWTQRGSLLTGVENTLDDFANSSLDSRWGTALAGSGSVTETTALAIVTGADADGALVYSKERYVRSTGRNLGIKARVNSVSNGMVLLSLGDEATAPVVGGTSAYNTKTVLDVYQGNTKIFIRYRDATTTYHWDGSAWGTSSAAFASSVGTYYQVWLENDGTQWRIVVKDEDGTTTHAATSWVAWSATRNLGNNLWFLFGDPWSDQGYGDLTVDWVKETDFTAYAGSYASKLVGVGTGFQGGCFQNPKMNVDPASLYTAMCRAKVSYRDAGACRVRVACYDSADTLLGNLDITTISAAQDWTLVSKTIGPSGGGADFAWPDGTVTAIMQMYTPSASLFAGYIDDVSLVGPKVSQFQFVDKPTYGPENNLWRVSAKLEVLP